jgi:hypothetical protein
MKEIATTTLIKPTYPIEYPNNYTNSSTSYKKEE